jgi:hypothetical protein
MVSFFNIFFYVKVVSLSLISEKLKFLLIVTIDNINYTYNMETSVDNKITEKNGFRIVNIQNLERKNDPYKQVDRYGNVKKELSRLDKVKKLSKNYSLKDNNIYYYLDTSTGKEVTYETNNFLGSFLNAYNNHYDVVLNPDNIWIMISLFFSKYVDKNAELLRSKFVNHEGQKNLVVVEYANSVEQSLLMEKHWDVFYEQIHEQVKKNTKEGVVDALKCDFSTTGIVEKIISTSVIMNSFQKYFKYTKSVCSCGINNVYFQGIRDDWVKLIKKTENLEQYDVDSVLKKYVTHVLVILNKFLDTWDGNVDLNFWNTIMSTEEKRISSGSYVNTKIEGWILHFFGLYEKIDLDFVPNYSISVPIEFENHLTGMKKNLDIIANWLSVSKVEQYAFKSDLGLAIIENVKGCYMY